MDRRNALAQFKWFSSHWNTSSEPYVYLISDCSIFTMLTNEIISPTILTIVTLILFHTLAIMIILGGLI